MWSRPEFLVFKFAVKMVTIVSDNGRCFFGWNQCGQVKEPYMETLKSLILDQEHITAVKRVGYFTAFVICCVL